MKRICGPLLWFLLVPYFTVRGLNVPAGIGGSREFTNRINAQLILTLILVAPIIYGLAAMGYLQAALPTYHPYVFAFVIYVPVHVLVGAWLKADREAGYRRKYTHLSFPARTAFGLTTVGLLVAGFVALVIPW